MPEFPPACGLNFFLLQPPNHNHHNLVFPTHIHTPTISDLYRLSFARSRRHHGSFLSASPGLVPASFSLEADTIDPLYHITSPLSSESPVPGPLNFSSASRSSSSSADAIFAFDVTSFNTDNHQQLWLPTPPPQQPSLAPPQNTISSSNNEASLSSSNSSLPEDFVLYPSAPAPHPPSRLRDSRAPALSSTAPRPSTAAHYPSRRHSLALQHYLKQQFSSGASSSSSSSTRLVPPQSTGRPASSSLRSSPLVRKPHAFQRPVIASAPANSPNHPQRPPVPLFHSTGHIPQTPNQQIRRRIMSTPNIAQGKHDSPTTRSHESQLTRPSDLPDLFDFPSHFGDELDGAGGLTMLSPAVKTTSFGPVAGSGTVSPKDLMMDASAPPSTSFTDLSTPSFESPGCFSQDTSPMFATDLDLAPGHEEWDPLFPVSDTFSAAFDAATLDLATALTHQKREVAAVPASPVIRSAPSPTRSPASGRVTKHSTVAGVNARQRKPLPPIKVDSDDPVALKRARNTEAARKSRARKLERQEDMERRIAELEKSLEEAERREQYWKALAQGKA